MKTAQDFDEYAVRIWNRILPVSVTRVVAFGRLFAMMGDPDDIVAELGALGFHAQVVESRDWGHYVIVSEAP